jgi:hypothetical protein
VSNGLSYRKYGEHRKALGLAGHSPSAVKKAVDTGRITVNADGKIDPERADLEWEKNTDSSRGRTAPRRAAPPRAEQAPRPAEAPTRSSSRGDEEIDLNVQRARAERAKADKAELELAVRAGTLVNADDAARAYGQQISAAKSILRGRHQTLVERLCRAGGVPRSKFHAVAEVLRKSDDAILRELAGESADA